MLPYVKGPPISVVTKSTQKQNNNSRAVGMLAYSRDISSKLHDGRNGSRASRRKQDRVSTISRQGCNNLLWRYYHRLTYSLKHARCFRKSRNIQTSSEILNERYSIPFQLRL
jgi:hypothetical protein